MGVPTGSLGAFLRIDEPPNSVVSCLMPDRLRRNFENFGYFETGEYSLSTLYATNIYRPACTNG